MSPFWLLMKAIMYTVVYGIVGFGCLFFGYRPTFTSARSSSEPFKMYNLPKVNGHRLFPVYFVLPIALLFLLISAFVYKNVVAVVIVGVLSILSVVMSLVWIITMVDDGAFYLISEWINAKTHRFCPVVEFTDGKEDTKE